MHKTHETPWNNVWGRIHRQNKSTTASLQFALSRCPTNRFSFSKVLKLDSPRRMSKSRPLIYFLSFWVTIEIASSDFLPAFPGTVPPAAQKRQVRLPRISCRIPVAPGSILASPSVTSEWKAPFNSWTQSDPIGPYRLDKMGIFSDWHLRFLHNFLVWDAQRSILTRITMPIYENLWKCSFSWTGRDVLNG